jgi:hypothetical protein
MRLPIFSCATMLVLAGYPLARADAPSGVTDRTALMPNAVGARRVCEYMTNPMHDYNGGGEVTLWMI